MDVVDRAVWFVESRFRDDIGLADIAQAAGVSRHHLTRAFAAASGRSLMRYVRARRLSEAARRLAEGAPDILDVALEAGYGSHEAFTRAFRDQFGQTPETVRARRSLDGLELVEAVRMSDTMFTDLEAPRFETCRAFLVAGLGERYTFETNAGIPDQWQRFAPLIGSLPGEVPGATYGLCRSGDDEGSYEYVCGVEVTNFAGLPPELQRVRVPAQRYAVFTHRGHISTIRRSHNTIWNRWLPASGHEVADAPNFEKYGPGFDPATGDGGLEIWIPIQG